LTPSPRQDAIRLVVNADDLGLHPSIDAGILRAHREGIVTSATVLTTGRSAARAIAEAKAQHLPLGVHLCLTTLLPPAADPSRVPSLVPDGRFRPRWPHVVAAWGLGRIRLEEVEIEFRAQIALARRLGAEPDHLDGHQHLHVLPGLARVVRAIALDERLPVRWPIARPSIAWLWRPGSALKTAGLAVLSQVARGQSAGLPGLGTFEAGALTEDRLMAIVSKLPPGDHEIGCHPGETADQVPEQPGWKYGWEDELRALCSDRVRALIERRGIKLASYGELG
jgi:predicted glycoside hydrolase/deacetylase ChbG (UPF0249 family)